MKTQTGISAAIASFGGTFLTIALSCILILSGCRGSHSEDPPVHLNRNMDTQNKYKAQAESDFFAGGAAMRTPPEGTVARGQLREDDAYYRGKDENGSFIGSIPFEVTPAVLKRGEQRFNIFCSPCHGTRGDGRGKIMEYKYPVPPTSFYHERVLAMNDGNLFDIISNGIRNMPSYRQQIPVRDRWSIVAHVRELQKLPPPPAPAKEAEGQTESNTETEANAETEAADQQQAVTE